MYTHGVFYNFIDDDPDDHGMAVVDIFRMDEEGKAAEHWDVLQLVGDPVARVRERPIAVATDRHEVATDRPGHGAGDEHDDDGCGDPAL